MFDKRTRRLRFSIRALLATVTILAVGLGGWIAYSNFKIKELADLRRRGAIVVFRNRTPEALQAIGINQLYPFYLIPTVELYVIPRGENASVGNSEEPTSSATAQKDISELAAEARSCGAKDVQLILLDSFDSEWTRFATANSMTTISDTKDRYLARLRANQETGANINPQ